MLAAGFFVIDYAIARWHLYLLTDSLYISLVAVATWATHRAVGRGARAYLAACAVLLMAALVRPNGWLMVPVAAIYWIARSGLGRRMKRAAAAGVVLVCLGGAATIAVVQFGDEAIARRSLTAEQRRQRLPFAGVMTLRQRLNPARMPLRLAIELAHVQPKSSIRHNVMVVAVLAVVYPLAVVGFVKSRGQPLARLMAAIVAGHLMVIAVTFFDRDGRYLLYFFPLLIVFAASGAIAIRDRRARRSV